MRKVTVLVVSLTVIAISRQEERDEKQLLVSGTPPRRLQLPGRGNDQISRLAQGPLTLHKGR